MTKSVGALAFVDCAQKQETIPLASGKPDQAIDAFANDVMRRYWIPGLSLVVICGGEVTAIGNYGFCDSEFRIPVGRNTVYQLASVTKIFTSLAVGILIDEGKFSFDTPVIRLMPELPTAWQAIAVHHLLAHTSGLPSNLGANPRFAAEERLRRDREHFVDEAKLDYFTSQECLAYLTELPLAFEPGAKWSYNQPGYMLLGMIIERVSKQSFSTFLQERIFRPLKMNSATFGDSRVVIPGRRQLAYTRQYGPLQNWIWPYSTTDYPAAGLNMTAADLATTLVAIDHCRILRDQTLERVWTKPSLASGGQPDYGLGWTIRELSGRKVVGHEGGGCSFVAYIPSKKLGAVALCNLAGSHADLGNELLAQFQ